MFNVDYTIPTLREEIKELKKKLNVQLDREKDLNAIVAAFEKSPVKNDPSLLNVVAVRNKVVDRISMYQRIIQNLEEDLLQRKEAKKRR